MTWVDIVCGLIAACIGGFVVWLINAARHQRAINEIAEKSRVATEALAKFKETIHAASDDNLRVIVDDILKRS